MTIQRRELSKLLGLAALAPASLVRETQAASNWEFEANVAECCSCEIPCPCNFGRPTSSRCDGNRLIEITSGQLHGADLAGIRFLVTFEMREWTRIYIDDSLDREQLATPAAEVEMKPIVGLDGGAISISGLPSNVFHDYVQYESVRHVHKGPDRSWSHSGTNGFTSRMLASG